MDGAPISEVCLEADSPVFELFNIK